MNDSRNNAGTFIKGATILAVTGVLSRLLGLLYKVPLYALVGSFGNGIYSNVYSIYNTLLTVSTVGLPVGISKMISEAAAQKNFRETRSIFKVSTLALCIVGGASTFFLFFGARGIISLSGWSDQSYPAIIAIAAAPFIISICSAFRGYFQGFQIMKPTAVSQIVEQIIRVGLGIALTWMALRMGYGVGMAVGGAILGATIGGLFAAILLFILYFNFINCNKTLLLQGNGREKESSKNILKRLLWISVPVTLTSCLSSLFGTVDSLMYISRLAVAGIDQITATTMFGDFSNVDTIICIPLVISSNISVAMIPAISESFVLKDRRMISEKIDIAIRVCVLVALPCCVGLSILSNGIFDLLFPGSQYGPGLMRVFSYATLFSMIAGIFQSVLQSIDKMIIPMINLCIGAVIHIISCYIFLAVPDINIYGIGLANLLAFIFLTLSNYYFVKKSTKVKFDWVRTFVLPLIAATVMGGITWVVYNGFYRLAGNIIALFLAIIIAVIVYFFVLIMINGISESELEMIPGGHFLTPVFKVIHDWREKLASRLRRNK